MRSLLVKNSFLCYAIITIGQLWLYSLNLRSAGLYERVTLHSNEWIGSHIVLLIGGLLIFPATYVLTEYCKRKWKYLVYTAAILTILGAIALIAQYVLDLYLVTLFKDLTSESAYVGLDQIRSSAFIKFICYDLIAAWLLGQVLFTIALFKNPNYPKWALCLFLLGLGMVVFGARIHDLLERLSYLIISIALWPVFKEKLLWIKRHTK